MYSINVHAAEPALTFSPGSQKLSCKSCGNSFDPKTLQQYTEDEQATDKQDIEWNFQADSPCCQSNR